MTGLGWCVPASSPPAPRRCRRWRQAGTDRRPGDPHFLSCWGWTLTGSWWTRSRPALALLPCRRGRDRHPRWATRTSRRPSPWWPAHPTPAASRRCDRPAPGRAAVRSRGPAAADRRRDPRRWCGQGLFGLRSSSPPRLSARSIERGCTRRPNRASTDSAS